ncbi:MAG TPA: secondary thiamine-phosphate synthase enzyme YjbQ [Candidatus Polarisedimenticolia bacterium]|nr:secondary thiamine-phosphate synthase enzyme YjbQ [Candidatus Polarisedimenticolia bacterium]
MRTHTLEVKTRARTEFVPLSARIAREASALLDGDAALLVYVPHTTAAVFVNEGADPDVMGDMGRVLDRLVPWESKDYRHSEGNTAAHVKAVLIGTSVTVPVRQGKLRLGRWQEIFFCEFDGPRSRTVELQLLPG